MRLDYRSVIVEESARFLQLLRAGPLDARVRGCPDWNLGDLGVHLVGVQRWATQIVTIGVAPESDAALPDPSEAATALPATTAALLAALDAANPDDPCWNFGPGPQLKSFWFRRQALEVAVHRWDAESAVSSAPTPLPPNVAADVIDELVTMSLFRAIERDGIDLSDIKGYVRLVATDQLETEQRAVWVLGIEAGQLVIAEPDDQPTSADRNPSAVVVRAEACDLALFLYNRIGHDRIEITGAAKERASWGPLLTL